MEVEVDAIVSIFTPVFNSEKYVEKCIQSVLIQSYSNFVWTIYDDGSTDNSYKICQKYALSDSRIKLTKGENGKSIEQMNAFITNEKSKYVAFIDNDDYWDENYLENMILALESSDADCAISSYTMVDSTGKLLNWYTPVLKNKAILNQSQLKKCFLTSLDIEGFRWNKIYKTAILQDSKIKLENVFPADVNFEYQLFNHVNRIVTVSETGYYYRQSSGSEAATINIKKCKSMLGTYERIGNWAINEGMVEEGKYYKAWRYINFLYNSFTKSALSKEQVMEVFTTYPWYNMVRFNWLQLIHNVYLYGDKKNGIIKFMAKTVYVWLYWKNTKRG